MSLAALLWKDVRRESRAKHGLQAGLVLVALFFVLDLFIFPDLEGQIRAATALLWTPLLYASAAIAGRGTAVEADQGTLDWLRTAPGGWVWIGVSRTLVDAALMVIMAAVAAGLAALLWDVPMGGVLALTLGLGVVGLAIIGSLAGALAAQAQAREVLLPILLVPVLAPLMMAGVDATLVALAGGTLADARPALLLMAGYDLMAAGIAWLLWPVVLESD